MYVQLRNNNKNKKTNKQTNKQTETWNSENKGGNILTNKHHNT